MSSQAALLVLACALSTAAVKAAGPIAFGGRPLPGPVAAVVGLLAPALLAALVVTQALADGQRLAIGPDTAGVALAGIAAWKGASVVVCVLIAGAVTALLRLLA